MGYIGCAVGGAYLTGSLRGAFGELGNEQTKKLLLQSRVFFNRLEMLINHI
jgi:hypothetical protein